MEHQVQETLWEVSILTDCPANLLIIPPDCPRLGAYLPGGDIDGLSAILVAVDRR